MTAISRLPRGRHQLSRDDVAAAQRARILAALADTMLERGYADTPVSAVLKAAGVSRETFYQLFASKQDCFSAALTDTIDRLASGIRLRAITDHPGPPLDTFDRLLAAYLSALAAAPATARLFLIETYAAGPDAMQRRLELQQQFIDAVALLFGVAESAFGRFCCESLVGAVVSAVTTRVVRNEPAALPELRRPLVALAGRLFQARAL